MRACGQRYSGIKTLTTLMDMPKPMTAKNNDKLSKRYSSVSKEIAEETMSDAAKEKRPKISTEC